ncbi:hypothetical protein [Halobacterium jilantaiense]|uniref:Ig-like domain-containing protein n=1 Tax=Halobacterium jilantaiense TaxID=355548 RepID=A0A1I0QKA2_9EURY|nr:hypothetical protein [Halobacterium jilantaiense]SEW27415.1 hypothetical protein SAMN04487945_2677 [Halobacterium jilantaiense]
MPETRRRALLAAVSGTLVAVAAGCLSPADSSPPADLSVRAIDADEYRGVPTALDTVPDGADATPFTGFGIGEERTDEGDDPPHCVWVWNATDRERELTVGFETDANTVFERSLTFAPDACAGFVLFTPAAYTVAVEGGDWRETTTVEASWFDCNASATDVVVAEGGRLDVGSVMQSMYCG